MHGYLKDLIGFFVGGGFLYAGLKMMVDSPDSFYEGDMFPTKWKSVDPDSAALVVEKIHFIREAGSIWTYLGALIILISIYSFLARDRPNLKGK